MKGLNSRKMLCWPFLPEAGFDAPGLEAILRPRDLAVYDDAPSRKGTGTKNGKRTSHPYRWAEFCAVRAHFHPPIPGVTPRSGHYAKDEFWHRTSCHDLYDAAGHAGPGFFRKRRCWISVRARGCLRSWRRNWARPRCWPSINDEWSIENAKENIIENHCISISARNPTEFPKISGFDIILANINKHVLLREMAKMEQQLEAGGVILMSGLLHEDFEDIENEAGSCNLSVSVRMTRGSWICLKMEKSPN